MRLRYDQRPGCLLSWLLRLDTMEAMLRPVGNPEALAVTPAGREGREALSVCPTPRVEGPHRGPSCAP